MTTDVVVSGDACIDLLLTSTQPHPVAGALAWQGKPRVNISRLHGGSLLLADMVAQATGAHVARQNTDTVDRMSRANFGQPPGGGGASSPGATGQPRVVHSVLEAGSFPARRGQKPSPETSVYRIERIHGFEGPPNDLPFIPPIDSEPSRVRMVVLQDDANGYREDEKSWPNALRGGAPPEIILLKLRQPFQTNPLRSRLQTLIPKSRLVTVLAADELRAAGVHISRRLSWERTATDLVWQAAVNRQFGPYGQHNELVVLFGLDGAIHLSEQGAILHYDPQTVEDGFRESYPGQMLGTTLATTAVLAAGLLKGQDVGESIRAGIEAARYLHAQGFGKDPNALAYPVLPVGAATTRGQNLYQVKVPPVRQGGQLGPDPSFWYITRDRLSGSLEDIACRVVREGEEAALPGVPIAQFGTVRTIDRAEMESYRSIKNLVQEYRDLQTPKRPLSIAVFGQPGSGKTRGVRELAESVAPGVIIPFEVNLAKLTSPEALAPVFHRTRDLSLEHRIPLVFFDEFDSAMSKPYDWLKHFLIPMQDGQFSDGGIQYPIGRAIFVFIGGTCHTCEDFVKKGLSHVEEKVPDFTSRLRGFVNVVGPNLTDEKDRYFILRRAVQLRSVLRFKAPRLFDPNGKARVDNGVLRAFLTTPRYLHGIRSIEALIDMSLLAGRDSFEKASLPPIPQMALHVENPELFYRIVLQDELFEAASEAIAHAIHELHRQIVKDSKPETDPTMQDWDLIDDALRASNRQRAKSLSKHLDTINHGCRPRAGDTPADLKFDENIIDSLAMCLHNEWLDWKQQVGGSQNPNQVPWNQLTDEIRQRNREAAKKIPELLGQFGFEVYRRQ